MAATYSSAAYSSRHASHSVCGMQSKLENRRLLGLRTFGRPGGKYILHRRIADDQREGRIGLRRIYLFVSVVLRLFQIDDAAVHVAGLREGLRKEKIEQ